MKNLLSVCSHYLWLVPVVGSVGIVLSLIVVTIALCRKRFVKASCQYGKFAFTLEARGELPPKPL
jgi:hypothetical protein